jgi:hypothetical protein
MDGVGNKARLQHPLGVVFAGGSLYVADTYNHKIKVVNPETAEIRTIAGSEAGWRDGQEPLLYEPGGLDAAGGMLFVADTNNHSVRVIDLSSGTTHTLVLKGIEKFSSSSTNGDASSEEVIRLGKQQVRMGQGSIKLEIVLPQGFKLNPIAPSSITWETQGGALRLPEDADGSLSEAELPKSLSVQFQEGSGQLHADLNIYYCEDDRESLCLIEMVQMVVPFEVLPEGTTELTLLHTIAPPRDLSPGD